MAQLQGFVVAIVHIYPPATGQRHTLSIGRSAHFSLELPYFVFGEIRTSIGVSSGSTFLWISLNSCPLNMLLVRSHQTEIIIVKHPIQERNNETRVRPWIRCFTMIIFAWWLRTSRKLSGQEFKEIQKHWIHYI